MTTLNQTALFTDMTLKNLRIKSSNATLPESAVIISAHATEKRTDEKDSKPIPNTIDKIKLSALDPQKVQALKSLGITDKEIRKLAFTIEIENDEEYLFTLDPLKLIGQEISLKEALLAPMWSGNGSNGAYRGLKIIINEVKLHAGKAHE
ncbi:hypothetical protein J0J34_00155 [Lactococcus garvieae]|uniref:hypothetical protein n=1 Tax=Lactococcus garvieae TaxID=1363 RepID=UPI001A8C11E9|nr:hypothetical protein [Lactococcus garvieae]QSR00263.1 hypothetical protein J0J34_00155 [Lactococcus garvieae]